MSTKEFTIDELEQMLSEAISASDFTALRQNATDIAKQLLAILKSSPNVKPVQFKAEELEKMIVDHETYWNDRFGRGDNDAENADELPRLILSITTQLIDELKWLK